jgi:(2R)-ethylmalonyl-CoA mutase
MPDQPWIMRTYGGHTSAAESNALFRKNLEKGQTGLSIAFDLPTQLGLDPDDPLARGEVGRVGVPVASLEDMEALMAGLPLERMNTSMTINATAPWIFALYVALAERRGVPATELRGTTQNDLLKEYLARGTYIFPPAPSMRLARDLIVWSAANAPRWNPINVSSYHLQEAGATPAEEISFALAGAIAVLDAVRAAGEGDLPQIVGRISFFLNAGIRFVEEAAKVRAFARLWDEIARERYGVEDAALRRFRYGVQVNSLGLSARQPEVNVARIVLEALAVLLPRNERARALQLPAWNEALGLPRPWDQQWSLRIQQVIAFETDLLERGDIFEGSRVMEALTAELVGAAREELGRIEALGGAVRAVESGYLKERLVRSQAARLRAIQAGEAKRVGENIFTETEPSPLTREVERAIVTVDPAAARDVCMRIHTFRARRDGAAVERALARLREASRGEANIVPPSIECARAGVTTGEWTAALREVFGEYRAPTGVGGAAPRGPAGVARLEALRARVRALVARLGRPPRVLVAKPGLDGHSNGAEQAAVLARDAGLEVIYQGIRLTPAEIARAATDEDVDAIGVSILSGAHGVLVPEVLALLRDAGLARVPVVVGGTIPPADAAALERAGVRAVFGPESGDLLHAVEGLVEVIETVAARGAPPASGSAPGEAGRGEERGESAGRAGPR